MGRFKSSRRLTRKKPSSQHMSKYYRKVANNQNNKRTKARQAMNHLTGLLGKFSIAKRKSVKKPRVRAHNMSINITEPRSVRSSTRNSTRASKSLHQQDLRRLEELRAKRQKANAVMTNAEQVELDELTHLLARTKVTNENMNE